MSLKQELRNSQLNAEVATNRGSSEVNNVDVLKRLSQLEKMVYGSRSKSDDIDNNN